VIGQHLDRAAPAQQFPYSLDIASSTAAMEGVPVVAISLVIGEAATPSWAWDAARQQWVRFMTGGASDTDLAGMQLGAVNVVVMRVDVTWDYDIPKSELVGGGEVWISTGGATIHGSWSKGSPTDRIRILDDHGVPVRLAPGNTWIELVPLEGSVEFAAAAPAA
jgi:hypothetical protein